MYHEISVYPIAIIGNGLWETQFLANNLWKVKVGCFGKYCEPLNTLVNHFGVVF